MIDNRLFLWQLLNILIILGFPLLRKGMATRDIHLHKGYFRPLIVSSLLTIVIQVFYYVEILASTEFLYLQLLVVIYFISSGFNQTSLQVISDPLNLKSIKKAVMEKISRAFGGSQVEYDDGTYKYVLTTPYRLKYDAQVRIERGQGWFSFYSRSENLRITKVLLLLSFYLTATAVIENTENVKFPFLDTKVSAVLVSITTIAVTIILIIVERNAIRVFSTEIPNYYKKALTSSALDSVYSTSKPKVKETAKDKAKALLERRDGNVLKARQEEASKKIRSVFGLDNTETRLDPSSLERVRLMNAVKRVLNSTPPWKTVTIKQIAKQVDGDIKQIEIIIAGLCEIGEVKGVYDIWSKEYHGIAKTMWMQTKSVVEAISEEEIDGIESVKIFPDGSSELQLKDKVKD